jgi:hypothetical protein
MLIKSIHGYVLDFDGEDYRWTADKSKAWAFQPGIDVMIHFNRLDNPKRALKVELVQP